MNTRKFIYIISIVVGLFLFILGSIFMFYINNAEHSDDKSPFIGILDGLNGSKKNKPMNFLVLVGDHASGNTDSIFVTNYNPVTNQISMLTIPRDTKVKLKNNILPKVNAAYAAGGRKHEGGLYASEVISDLTGININYYVYINISSIKKITDMLGGVYFDVPADLRYDDPTQDLYINLKKGYQLLDGDKVEQLLRFRKADSKKYTKAELAELKKYYDGSDIKRTEMQVKFIKEFISQKLTIQYLPRFNSIINYAFKNIVTNMTLTDALKLTSGVINISSDEFNSFRLDGTDKIINGGWYYVFNGKMLNTETEESLPAEEIVSKFFYSSAGIATPSDDDILPEDDKANSSNSTNKHTPTPKPSSNTKVNPSNNGTNLGGDGKDKP